MSDPIRITLGDDVKPWLVPHYATRTDGGSIAVERLSDGSLDVMAQDFINRLYQHAGRRPPVLSRTR